MQLAVCAEMVFLDLPVTERVRRVAEAGFDAEIWDWTRHDVEALAATGAMFSSMTGYVRGDFGDGADELIRTARESIAAAETLGCPRLNLHGTGLDGKGLPVIPGPEMPGPLWISAARTLERLGELAERADVTFCLENLNTAVDHPGVPFARAADTIALVEAVGHPRVRLMLDLYHAQIGEGNLIELVRRAGPLIGEIQVADVPGRREPGTGEINYPAIAAALADMGYEGTVGLEAWADGGDSDRALARFRSAFTPGLLSGTNSQTLIYGGTMRRVRQTSLAVLLAAALTITGLTAGTVLADPALADPALAQPAGHSLNLHHVKWGNVAVPGWLCRVSGPIRLHDGQARLRHSGFGPLDVSEAGPAYGDLGGQRVAALQVWCSNQGGTAAGELAEGLVVFSGAGGRLHVLGTLTPQYRPRHATHIPFVTVKSISAERVVTTEFFYTGSDADCCPSGRALTSWHWNGHSFKPGRTTITAS